MCADGGVAGLGLVRARSGHPCSTFRAARQAAAGGGADCGGRLRRLRCDARLGVAPQNSLRALLALRSNNCGEHEDEARCARRPHACASRRHTQRPRWLPPAAQHQGWRATRSPLFERHRWCCKAGCGQAGVRLCGAEARRSCGGARSALRQHFRRSCSSAAPAGRGASSAAHRRAEHCRAVGAADRHSEAPQPSGRGNGIAAFNSPGAMLGFTRNPEAMKLHGL